MYGETGVDRENWGLAGAFLGGALLGAVLEWAPTKVNRSPVCSASGALGTCPSEIGCPLRQGRINEWGAG